MSNEQGHIDIEQAKREAKEKYRAKTGEELPDHVLKNLELLSGPSLVDHAEIDYKQALAREPYEEQDDTLATVVILVWIATSGLVGVYASRFFVGWPAQIVGGAFVAALAAGVLLGGLEVIDRVR